MRKEHSSPEKYMRAVTCQAFKAFKKSGIDSASAKLVYQFVVVDRLLLAVSGDAALDVPWSNDLFVRLGIFWGRLDSWSFASPRG